MLLKRYTQYLNRKFWVVGIPSSRGLISEEIDDEEWAL